MILDTRYTNLADMTMGIISSSLSDGPVQASFYPGYPLSLQDPHINECIVLHLQTRGLAMKQGAMHVNVHYRFVFCSFNTHMPVIMNKQLKGSTMLITSDPHSQVTVTELLKWENLEIPRNWIVNTQRLFPSSSAPAQISRLPSIHSRPSTARAISSTHSFVQPAVDYASSTYVVQIDHSLIIPAQSFPQSPSLVVPLSLVSPSVPSSSSPADVWTAPESVNPCLHEHLHPLTGSSHQQCVQCQALFDISNSLRVIHLDELALIP